YWEREDIQSSHMESYSYVLGLDASTPTRKVLSDRTKNISKLTWPTSLGKQLFFSSSDGDDICERNNEVIGYRQVESLLNLSADLRVLRTGKTGGLVLQGTATDKNFDAYQLEYANLDQPEIWSHIIPASSIEAIDDPLATWVPPGEGNYLVR